MWSSKWKTKEDTQQKTHSKEQNEEVFTELRYRKVAFSTSYKTHNHSIASLYFFVSCCHQISTSKLYLYLTKPSSHVCFLFRVRFSGDIVEESNNDCWNFWWLVRGSLSRSNRRKTGRPSTTSRGSSQLTSFHLTPNKTFTKNAKTRNSRNKALSGVLKNR